MECLICKQAVPQPGVTTVTLERDGLTLVVKDVPARVCPNCDEAYVDEAVTAELLKTAGHIVGVERGLQEDGLAGRQPVSVPGKRVAGDVVCAVGRQRN